MKSTSRHFAFALALSCLTAAAARAAEPPRLKILFLGDHGHHQPAERFEQLRPVLAERNIELVYTDQVGDLNSRMLAGYDGLLLYANIERIEPDQEKALLDYVAAGHGFIPLHCASFCFQNSEKMIALVGAQFQRHGTGVFRVVPAKGAASHPIMRGYGGFASWDETYVHHKHNEKNRTVLAYRVEPGHREPWTWVRTHGDGRVFYTAWGHDARTWGNPGFQNLVERGIRWACRGGVGVVPPFADRPAMQPIPDDLKPFEYVEAKIAFYPPGGPRRGDGAWNKMQLPLPPRESMKHISLPVGFDLKLFAAEPQIGGKPIAMTWDERGRLYVSETYDYPNEMQSQGQGRDRIRIFEDTDHDGRADKTTVFAEDLSIPTSLLRAHGGLVVHQAPHTLFLRDTDGDDVADERFVLFTGWGTRDTHAGPSNLTYGPDNWIYGIVGYSGFEGEIAGQHHAFRQGFYRFKLDEVKNAEPGEAPVEVTAFEFLRGTNNNSWGVGFSEEGLLFGSTANGNPSEFMPLANRYYERVRGWSSSVLDGIADSWKYRPVTEKIRQVDWHGGYTAAGGHDLYTARIYPQAYWNRVAFVAEPTGHLVGVFILRPDGAGFRSSNPWNLLASDDEWVAPIAAEVGPDGNVWVIDWYNYIVQHNPTPAGFKTGKGGAYITDLRDKKHGRIYRVTYGDKTSPLAAVGLGDASPEELVAALKSKNLFWRRHAGRLLVERGKRDVVPALVKLAADESVDSIGLNVGATHALWTLDGLGALDGSTSPAKQAALAALEHPSAGVRRAALKVLPRDAAALAAILASGVLNDPNAQVRLAALLAVADGPASAEAAEAVRLALADASVTGDRWLKDAAVSAAARHADHFLKAVAAHVADEEAQPPRDALAIVAEHYARGERTDSAGELIQILADRLGGKKIGPAGRATAAVLVAGLAQGWPKDRPLRLDEATERAIAALLDALPSAAQAQLVTLAGRWGSKELEQHVARIAAGLLEAAGDEKLSDEQRADAAAQLVGFRPNDAEAAGAVLELISPRMSPALAKRMVEAVGKSQASEAGQALADRLAAFTPATREAALNALMNRAAWTRLLLDALERGKLPSADLSLVQRRNLAAHPDKKIAARAKKLLAQGGGLPSPDRAKVLAELMPVTQRTGDVAAGKQIFKKHCAKCHTHGGEGSQIGPDLTGMAVHPKRELLTHILDPSRSVEGNFRVYTAVTDEGRVFSGMLAGGTRTTIELIDGEAKRRVIERDHLDEFAASPKSLMPEGFEKQLSADDLANLLEFLTAKGRYVPVDLRDAATIVTTRGMFYDADNTVERLVFDDWKPKTFAGVPFHLIDPQGARRPNAIMLYGPQGKFPPTMPKRVALPIHTSARAIHLLSGVSGWGAKTSDDDGSVSMIVRLHYADGATEDHPLKNGVHFADYIGHFNVPKSQFAFDLDGRQIRYLAIHPRRPEPIRELELLKGPDRTAPVVMAVTVETGE